MCKELTWENHEKQYGKSIDYIPDCFHKECDSYRDAKKAKDSYESGEDYFPYLVIRKCTINGKYYLICED